MLPVKEIHAVQARQLLFSLRSTRLACHSNAIHNQRFKKRIELHRQTQPPVAEHRGGTNSRMKRPQPHPPHTRGTLHRRLQPLYHGKTQGFVLRLPPHKVAHATLTQPFPCDPQPEIQETHRTTQTNTTTRCRTQRRNLFAHETTPAAPAAHTRYLSSSAAATLYGKTQGFVLRLPPHKIAHATLTQPFQCDPQPEIQETPIELHRQTQPLVAEHRGGTNSRMKRPQPHPPHTRGTLHRRLQPLYTEKQGFVLRLPPHKVAHATLTQPFQCDPQPEIQETPIELHRQTQPLVAEHRGGTNSRMKRPQPHPPHTRGTLHRRLQPLYTEKHTGFVLRLPPHKVAHATLTQPFQCDPQPEIQETHRTTQTNTTTRCRTQRRNLFAHETTPAAPAAHTRYLASSPAATLHGKTQGFVLRLPPHKVAHATLTQPFQCDLPPQLQEAHRTTHTATTTRCKTHRGQTRYLSSPAAATLHGKTQGFVLRLPPQNIAHATFMQPLHCVSQHPVAYLHLSTDGNTK